MESASALESHICCDGCMPASLVVVRDQERWAQCAREHATDKPLSFALVDESCRALDFGAARVVPVIRGGRTSADLLKALLRADIDLVAVEIADDDTAFLSVRAAARGVLVVALVL